MKTVVNTKAEAWAIVDGIFKTDYNKCDLSSERAGYDVYRHRQLNPNDRICDLGDRLEITVDGETKNIWINEPFEPLQKSGKKYGRQNGFNTETPCYGASEVKTIVDTITALLGNRPTHRQVEVMYLLAHEFLHENTDLASDEVHSAIRGIENQYYEFIKD